MKKVFFLILISFFAGPAYTMAQSKSETDAGSPTDLPGGGLSAHDFFYAGEGNHVMSIVKRGKVVWSYQDTAKRGEISDAVMLSNGNVLFAHQFGITEFTKNKVLVWNYNAPPNTEIHTAEPIGKNKILYIQNGNPAKMIVVDIRSGKKVFEIVLEVNNALSVHGQFRHASITGAGTVLVAHMDMNKVREYNGDGKVIWSLDVPSPWDAERLASGNTLISSNSKFVREVNPAGETVWEFTPADLPGFRFSGMQRAKRLRNGNTLINNWAAKGDGTEVQAVEIDSDKKLIWALCSWVGPVDLGRSTTIQLLGSDMGKPEDVYFGNIK